MSMSSLVITKQHLQIICLNLRWFPSFSIHYSGLDISKFSLLKKIVHSYTYPPFPSRSPVFAKKYCRCWILPNAITLSLERAEFENSVPSGLENPLRFISPLFVRPRPNENRLDDVDESEAAESDLSIAGASEGGVIGGD